MTAAEQPSILVSELVARSIFFHSPKPYGRINLELYIFIVITTIVSTSQTLFHNRCKNGNYVLESVDKQFILGERGGLYFDFSKCKFNYSDSKLTASISWRSRRDRYVIEKFVNKILREHQFLEDLRIDLRKALTILLNTVWKKSVSRD